MARPINNNTLYAHFLTLTVTDWVDIFTRKEYKHIFIDSLNHCIAEKGLEVYAWVWMSNHAHLVVAAKGDISLSDIMRDMKKFMSKKIVKEIEIVGESRREWMLHQFAYAGKFDSNIKDYRFWQEGNFPKECTTREMLLQKIAYVHLNPVRAEIVSEPHHYLYSSAIDYAGGKGLVAVVSAY